MACVNKDFDGIEGVGADSCEGGSTDLVMRRPCCRPTTPRFGCGSVAAIEGTQVEATPVLRDTRALRCGAVGSSLETDRVEADTSLLEIVCTNADTSPL